MNEKIKIVLADDNKDFCQVLKEYLSNESDIEILGIAKDGIEEADTYSARPGSSEHQLGLAVDIKSKKLDKKTATIVGLATLGAIMKTNNLFKKIKEKEYKMRLNSYGYEVDKKDYLNIVIKEYKNCSLVEFTLKTGRTHQIRIHASYINHPLLGDVLYGGNFQYIDRVALHSYKIELNHPITNQLVSIKIDIPEDMKKNLN